MAQWVLAVAPSGGWLTKSHGSLARGWLTHGSLAREWLTNSSLALECTAPPSGGWLTNSSVALEWLSGLLRCLDFSQFSLSGV